MTVTIASLLEDVPVSSGATAPWAGITANSPNEPAAVHTREALRLRVLWGSLTDARADIHVAGHYQGVLPASAEAALDAAISPHRGVIAEHTRRRWLVGELGEIGYFPGRDPQSQDCTRVRRAAVAGMGRLGTFTEDRAEQMYGSLLRELGTLTDVRSAAMVLIGSGAGNLSVIQAVRALVKGFSEVMPTMPTSGVLGEVVITEVDRLRAEQVAGALMDLTRESTVVRAPVRVEHGAGGTLCVESAAVFTVRAIAHSLRRQSELPQGRSKKAPLPGHLLDALPEELREFIPTVLRDVPDDLNALSVVLGAQSEGGAGAPPTRISVSHRGDRMRWAALTERATIPEREIPVKPRLVADLVTRLTAPVAADAARLPGMLRRWVIPEDFQNHITARSPLVLEVNGAAAQLPWEFLTDSAYESGQDPLPLALRTPIARQLRTTYSRAVADYAEPTHLRALVVADPGPPARKLPGARAEGIALAKLLRSRGVDVSLFVGPPGTEPPEGGQVATELDVLTELLVGRYDIVHFAGHGTMSQDRPDLAGWLFCDGVLAAAELTQMTWAPRLVTANACWTASGLGRPDTETLHRWTTPAGGQGAPPAGSVASADGTDERQRARLTAVLADEFLRVGVAHYIGTSWQVPDSMGLQFALSFYDRVLPTAGRRGEPFGRALCGARQVLFGMRGTTPEAVRPETWSGWAAYQHFGDPADVLDTFEPAAVPAPTNGRPHPPPTADEGHRA